MSIFSYVCLKSRILFLNIFSHVLYVAGFIHFSVRCIVLFYAEIALVYKIVFCFDYCTFLIVPIFYLQLNTFLNIRFVKTLGIVSKLVKF